MLRAFCAELFLYGKHVSKGGQEPPHCFFVRIILNKNIEKTNKIVYNFVINVKETFYALPRM